MEASKSRPRSGPISARKASAESRLERKTSAALAELRRTLPGFSPEKRTLIAVSGGRDSVALLHCLHRLSWLNLVVVHLNHGLRARASEGDEKFVRELAAKLEVPCRVQKTDVAKIAARLKLSIETAGREARRTFFRQAARTLRCDFIFTAHHAGDQAETVLHRLCRGASLAGAAAMLPAAESIPGLVMVRPFLHVSRIEIDQYIAAHHLKYREDSSNRSADHTRNRVRHEVVPLMNDVFQRDVSPLLGRFATLAGRDDEALQQIARAFATKHAVIAPDKALRLTRSFCSQHPAVQSRIIHRWLTETHGVSDVGSHEIGLALQMVTPGSPGPVNLPGGTRLFRAAGRLQVEQQGARGNARFP